MSRKLTAVAVALVLCGAAATLSAQTSNFTPVAPDQSRPTAGGWTFTPALVLSTSWDDNVLVRGQGDSVTGDYTNVVNPRISTGYSGRRTRLDASYDGAFLMYREFSDLNSYDQHASLFFHQLLSKHVSFFANDTVALVPTTELVELVGVPFIRTGSAIEDARTGIEVAFSNRTAMTVSYNFQWVKFNDNGDRFTQLEGGHSHGGSVSLRHMTGKHTTVFTSYDLQRAVVINGLDAFNVQNAMAGVEQKLSTLLHVYGAIGVAHVGVTSFGPSRTGPAWRAGLTRQFRAAGVDLDYSRSFVPSYGFGGTMQNEEVTARLRLPLARRLSAESSFSWRSNESLKAGEPNLHSRWLEGNLSYAFRPWIRVEGFYASSNQTIDRPGGVVDRTRVGVQLVTSSPMRIR